MEQVKRYEFKDEVIENPIYLPSGRPVLWTIEDVCPYTDMADDDPDSIDCGSCRHYHQFPGSLMGVCRNEQRRSGVKPKRTKARAKKEDTT